MVFTILLAVILCCIPVFARPVQETQEVISIVNLTVDVIPGADVGSGSRENWLRERAEAFEKENEGVYITVRSLKADQAQLLYGSDLREQMGNIAAYTGGTFVDDRCFLPLEHGEKAQLYMYGGYVLLVNPALCLMEGESLKTPSVAASVSQFDSGAILACAHFKDEVYNVQPCERAEMISLFAAQEVSAIVASNYVAYRFCRAAQNGEGFPVAIYPLQSPFTDQGHFVSVIDQTDVENDVAMRFTMFLLEEESQNACKDIGMFSVSEQTYEGGTILSTLWENQTEVHNIAPPFAWHDAREMAVQLTIRSLEGDTSSLQTLFNLLKNLP